MMRMIVMVMLIGCGAMMSTGCVAPRAAGLYLSALADAPLPHRAKRLGVSITPFVGCDEQAGFHTKFECDLSVHELVQFYRAHWKRLGWIETKSASTSLLTCARRCTIGTGPNALVLFDEAIELRADDQTDLQKSPRKILV